jgi:outer membrane protein assembly factor BamB
VALRAGQGGSFYRLWQAQLGPVYRRPGAYAAGRTLFVPSADHLVYALDAATGRTRWQFDASAPVLSAPVSAAVGNNEYVLFSAGRALFAVEATTGQLVWSLPGRGFSSGRAACDGRRVYTSAADGYARAHDARTGQELWSHEMVSGDEHHVVARSGWDNVVALGSGLAIVGSVANSWALDAATGALRWTFPGSSMYAPTVVLGDGTALFTTEWGVMSRVDLASGATRWQTHLGVRIFNAGIAVQRGNAWAQSADGKLIGVRLSDGGQVGWRQHSLVCSFSSPAIVGDTLVTGDQNGAVRGMRILC